MTTRLPRGLAPVLLALLLGGCGAFRYVPAPAPLLLRADVIRILDAQGPTPEFFRNRAQLETMGAELDEVLVPLIDDTNVNETIRANAAILLADRRSFVALPVLRRVLLGSPNETVRVGALLGLVRLAPDAPDARTAIRAAINDPSEQVRLNVLQALDVADAPLLRSLLARESNAQVVLVGRQLLGLLEARGAPLRRSATGEFRTSGADSTPGIVFSPAVQDTVTQIAFGALWVEKPGHALVPLAQEVESVADVVPAFFDLRGEHVVFEAAREIRIRNLRNGALHGVGPGLAPRPIPFTDRFVFVREIPGTRILVANGTRVGYEVLRAGFAGGLPERIGTLEALIQPERHGAASPVRWMEVAEARNGFVLQGEGILTPFLLPDPFRGAEQPRRAPPAVTRPAQPCAPTPISRPRPRSRSRPAAPVPAAAYDPKQDC